MVRKTVALAELKSQPRATSARNRVSLGPTVNVNPVAGFFRLLGVCADVFLSCESYPTVLIGDPLRSGKTVSRSAVPLKDSAFLNPPPVTLIPVPLKPAALIDCEPARLVVGAPCPQENAVVSITAVPNGALVMKQCSEIRSFAPPGP